MDKGLRLILSICEKINASDALDVLIEECAELIQAASKIKRIINRDSNVDADAASKNLVEELADVLNGVSVVAEKLLSDDGKTLVEEIELEKLQRWYRRLSERS